MLFSLLSCLNAILYLISYNLFNHSVFFTKRSILLLLPPIIMILFNINSAIESFMYTLMIFIINICSGLPFSTALTRTFLIYASISVSSLISGRFSYVVVEINLYFFLLVHMCLSILIILLIYWGYHIILNRFIREQSWIQDFLFIPFSIIFLYDIYEYLSTYLNSEILLKDFQQKFFRQSFWIISMLFILSCIFFNLALKRLKEENALNSLRIMERELNKHLGQQALTNKLFIHDKIKLINQLQEDIIRMSHQNFEKIHDDLTRAKAELIKWDQGLLSLALIKPIILQDFLYNQLVYFQQQYIECHFEISQELEYKGKVVHLIKLLDLIFQDLIGKLSRDQNNQLSLSIFEDGNQFIILITSNVIDTNEIPVEIKDYIQSEFPEIFIRLSKLDQKNSFQWLLSQDNV